MKYLVMCLIFLFSLIPIAYAFEDTQTQHVDTQTQHVYSPENAVGYSPIVKSIRRAAVKVIIGNGLGHGSGSYVKLMGGYFVITAAHVVDAPDIPLSIEGQDGEVVRAFKVYSNTDLDIAILSVEKMNTRRAMPFLIQKNILDVNDILIYSGYPSHHKLLSFMGKVSGYETHNGLDVVIMHGYGWPGSSGSVLYNANGSIAGVLWGIDVGRAYVPQLIEDIIWLTPSSAFNMDEILESVCKTQTLRALPRCLRLEKKKIKERFQQ